MRYIVNEGSPLRLGGVEYVPGTVIEVLGRDQYANLQDRLITIEDAQLIRALEVNSHPYVVLAPFRWGRRDYAVGELFWAVTRSQLKDMPAGGLRPAQAREVLEAIRAGRVANVEPPAATKRKKTKRVVIRRRKGVRVEQVIPTAVKRRKRIA